MSFANRKEQLVYGVMDVRPYFPILNSPEKMMTCSSRHKEIFEVPHPVQEYTKMRIPDNRNRTDTVRIF